MKKIKPDPRRRKDLTCALPGCDKKLQPPSTYAGEHGLSDPFCSSSCCRAYHGNPLPSPTPSPLA